MAMPSTLSQVSSARGALLAGASSLSERRNATCRIGCTPVALGVQGRLFLGIGDVSRGLSARRPGMRSCGGKIRALTACKSHDDPWSMPRHELRMGQAVMKFVDALLKVSEAVRQLLLATPFPKPRSAEEAALAASLKCSLVLSAAPLLFAATSVSTPLTVVASGMAKWLELYSGVLMVRVLLSWFPNIPWERQPLQAMRDMCDPYLNLFRNIIPPIFNALDVSPMLAFLVLGTLTSILNTSVQG